MWKTQTSYRLTTAVANKYGLASMCECLWAWDEREVKAPEMSKSGNSGLCRVHVLLSHEYLAI